MSEISDLMEKDPLELTRVDRTKIIAFYREYREKFISGAKIEKKPPPEGGLKLSDLKLE